MELPHIEPVFEDDVESLVPEAVLSFFGTNKECILSAISIAKLCDDQRSKEIALELRTDIEAIKSTERDGLSRGGDKELERMELALESLEEAAQSCLDDANAEISEGIGSMSLKGEEVLTMLKTAGTSTLLASLPKEFFDLILTTARKFEDAVAEKLEIDKGWTRGLFSTDTHPLMIDAERLSEIKVQLAAEKNRAEFDAKRRIAKRLSKHIPLVKTLVRRTMELDLRLALGEFVIDYKLTQPQLQEELGLGFRKGRNLRLKEKVQPVDYVIGSSDLFPGRKERAVVITGANSGGKTTLLELVAQVVLMAHMGLGAPADVAKTSLFDEVYYFGKGQGDDAGAFETLLKTFEGLTRSSRRKIILTDELEAITEPGAAAKILAALLEWFKEDKSTIIAVVTHLGEDIKEHVNEEVRIDGIQATGLDEEFNLVVDRNPVLGKVARSTPELIVERLSRISSKKGFYNRILDRFR
ncbi:MAG: AAA family ATPase [Candidatus Hydrothermarchaeales archaeon]